MNSFGIDGDGNFTVSYTITGEDSPPFSIGIFGSADGSQPTSLLQSYEIDDPTLLTGGGQSHTASFTPDLSGVGSNPCLIAVLDCNDEVRETTKADNRSAAISRHVPEQRRRTVRLRRRGDDRTWSFLKTHRAGP